MPTRLRTHDCSLRPLDAPGVSPRGSSQASPPPAQAPPRVATVPCPRPPLRALGAGPWAHRGKAVPLLVARLAPALSPVCGLAAGRGAGGRLPQAGRGKGGSGLQTWVAPHGPLGTQPGADEWGSGETLAEDWRLGAGPRPRWEGSCREACGGHGWHCRCPSSPFRHITPLLGLRAPLREGVKECWATWQAGNQPLVPGFCHATMPPGEGPLRAPLAAVSLPTRGPPSGTPWLAPTQTGPAREVGADVGPDTSSLSTAGKSGWSARLQQQPGHAAGPGRVPGLTGQSQSPLQWEAWHCGGDWGPAPARVPLPGTLCHPAEPQGGPWGWESRNLVVSQVRSPWGFPLARSTWGRPEVLSGPEGTSGFF